MRRNLERYHRSIGAEIMALEDRIRFLIGSSHWLSDGEYKESIIRTVLRSRIPESSSVGSGFVIFPSSDDEDQMDNSTQIDILIHSKFKPTFFRDGDFVIITPDAAQVLLEVKTNIAPSDYVKIFKKLGKIKKRIIESHGNTGIRVGVFSYGNTSTISDGTILNALRSASMGDPLMAVDYFSCGLDRFFLFWENGDLVNSPVSGPVWHSYYMEGLAQAYIISNIISVTSELPDEISRLWFPIEGTKEVRRTETLGLNSPA